MGGCARQPRSARARRLSLALSLALSLSLVLALLLASAMPQAHADACQALLPQSLTRALERAYPGYRTPLETDNAPDDIERDRSRGGTGCLGVDSGDFTGEGKKDYIVGLTARKGRAGLAVIALPQRGGWQFLAVHSGAEDARFLQFVTVTAAGHYERPSSTTAPLEPEEAAHLVCDHAGVQVGRIGASARVYCAQAGRWRHVAAEGR